MKLLIPFLAVTAVFFSSCAGSRSSSSPDLRQIDQALTSPASSATKPAESTLIEVGDSLAVSIWGYSEFNSKSLVKENGTVYLPLIGEFKVEGKTREEFEGLYRKRLATFVQGVVKLTIEILKPIRRITVLGAVARPGSFNATTSLSLLEVLSQAGGWTPGSDLRNLSLTRSTARSASSEAIAVNLKWHLQNNHIKDLPAVQPGDVVYVPEEENFVRDMSDFFRDAFSLFGIFIVFANL